MGRVPFDGGNGNGLRRCVIGMNVRELNGLRISLIVGGVAHSTAKVIVIPSGPNCPQTVWKDLSPKKEFVILFISYFLSGVKVVRGREVSELQLGGLSGFANDIPPQPFSSGAFKEDMISIVFLGSASITKLVDEEAYFLEIRVGRQLVMEEFLEKEYDFVWSMELPKPGPSTAKVLRKFSRLRG